MTEVVNSPVNYLQGSNQAAFEDCKIFVGGLSWDTTQEDLHQYFGQYGAITDVNVKYNANTGNHRGFAFITFASSGSIDAVLANGPHTLKEKVIDPRKAKSRSACDKIFVGGLDPNIAEEEIKQYFSRYGSIKTVELPFDRVRGRRREFCFIIFDSEESADAACQDSKQVLGGRECDVKKAQPQQRSMGQRNGGSFQRGNGSNGGGSPNHYGQSPQVYGNTYTSQQRRGGGGNWRSGGQIGNGNGNGQSYRSNNYGDMQSQGPRVHRRVYNSGSSAFGGQQNYSNY